MTSNGSISTRATANSELMVARAREYVQPSLDRDLWNTGIQAVLDVCRILEAATVYEEFAVLGTDEDGDEWITAEKYDDRAGAQVYAKRFGGTVHRRSVGEWVEATP